MWPEVGDPLNWKTYWTGLEEVRAAAPEGRPAVGAVYDLTFKSFLPYTLTLTARLDEYAPPHRMTFHTAGELQGVAEFVLDEVDGGTRTRLVWTTHTTKTWMNVLAFLLRPLFEWNHDFLMRRAGTGLAERIGARVTHAEGSAPSLARALLPLGAAVLAIIGLFRRSRT